MSPARAEISEPGLARSIRGLVIFLGPVRPVDLHFILGPGSARGRPAVKGSVDDAPLRSDHVTSGKLKMANNKPKVTTQN